MTNKIRSENRWIVEDSLTERNNRFLFEMDKKVYEVTPKDKSESAIFDYFGFLWIVKKAVPGNFNPFHFITAQEHSAAWKKNLNIQLIPYYFNQEESANA